IYKIMAVTITKQPYKYAPSQNPIIWEFESNNVQTVYFDIIIKNADNQQLLSKHKIFLPPSSTRSFIDISKVLDNLTITQIDNTETVFKSLAGTLGYIVEVTGYNGNGVVTDPKIITNV